MNTNGTTVRAAEMLAPITVEHVMYHVDGVRCAADLYLPAKIAEGHRVPGVVMGHSVIMVKEALRPHAEYLVRAGFGVLAIDYRTIGSSGAGRVGSGSPNVKSRTCGPGCPTC
jgi:predicted alpha/beta hydrolase